MDNQYVIEIIEKLKYKYSDKADKTLEKALKSIDAQRISELSIVASRYDAKADALEELIEKLQEEDE